MNSNTFQDQPGQARSYKFGSLSHGDPAPPYAYSEPDWSRNLRCFKLARDFTERTTPQIRDIVAILKSDGRGEWSSADISALMSKAAGSGKLKTRQIPERIFTYYLKDLLNEGVLAEIVEL